MKKVGIITFHCSDNFGAVLQVYALQEIIKEMNLDVEIIDFRPKELTEAYDHSVNFRRTLSNKGLIKSIKATISKFKNYRKIENRLNSFKKFRSSYLRESNSKFYLSEDLVNNPPNYDYFITGSDQVWNPSFKKSIGDSYFLDFVDDKSIKISYAASIAQSVEDELVHDYKKYINRFDFISIREKSSLEFLSEITDKSVEVTLDPTLLLNNEKWKNISKAPNTNEKYILVYDLIDNTELVELANRYSNETGLKIISYSKITNYENGLDAFKYKGPDEFLGLFENAEIIFTNSFHGTVFSLIYNKPFYTMPHPTRGSRMVDLLRLLELDNRIIRKANDVEKVDYYINYNNVNAILNELRSESLNFLKNSIK